MDTTGSAVFSGNNNSFSHSSHSTGSSSHSGNYNSSNILTRETCSGSTFNTTPKNCELTEKQAMKALNRMIDQVVEFGDRTNNLFFNRDNTFSNKEDYRQSQWNSRVKLAKEDLVACQTIVEATEDKIDLIDELSELNICCTDILTRLEEIDTNKEIQPKEKLEQLKQIIDSFIEKSDYNFNIFTKAVNKLNKLKSKIEKHDPILKENAESTKRVLNDIMLRVQNIIPTYMLEAALEKSFEKDELRIDKFDTLKEEWLEALIQYNNVEDHIQRSSISLKTLPILSNYCKRLNTPKEYFSSLNKCLENISPNTVAKDFVEKYQKKSFGNMENYQAAAEKEGPYKRDLTPFLNCIRDYKEKLGSFTEAEKIIESLNESRKKFLPIVLRKLNEISEEIDSIKARNHESLKFVDEEMAEELKTQKKDSLESLNLLRDQIEQQWNQFCMELYALNHQKITFNAFKSINEKMSWCFILAEDVQGNLRNLRKTEDNRNAHYELFFQKCEDYRKLCKLVVRTNDENSKDQLQPLDVSSLQMPWDTSNCYIFNSISLVDMSSILQIPDTYSQNSNNSLKSDFEKAMKHKETFTKVYSVGEQSNPEAIAEAIGLVWVSDDSKSKILKAFNEQRINFSNQLSDDKKIAREAFTITLPAICKIAANEVNREGLTLSEADDSYNDNFTKAYWAENLIGNALQHVGTAIVSTFAYREEKKEKPIDFKPILSPFDVNFDLSAL